MAFKPARTGPILLIREGGTPFAGLSRRTFEVFDGGPAGIVPLRRTSARPQVAFLIE